MPEVEAVRGDIVLRPHAVLGNVLPRKAERLPAPRVHLAVKHRQTVTAIQRLGLHPQPFEVAHDIGLHTAQPGPGLGHAASGQPKGDVLGALNAVVALGDLAFEHLHIFMPDAVELVLLFRDVHLVAVGAAGTAVDKGELKGQGTVEVVEKRAPPAEDGGLILGGRHGVVDVLIFHGLGVEPAGELTDPVRVHRHIGDGLLGGHHRPALISFCVWFCFGCVQ